LAKTGNENGTPDSRLKDENERLRQRQLLRDDEIKDLRQKNLKLELEIKEKIQRERTVSKYQYFEGYIPCSSLCVPVPLSLYSGGSK